MASPCPRRRPRSRPRLAMWRHRSTTKGPPASSRRSCWRAVPRRATRTASPPAALDPDEPPGLDERAPRMTARPWLLPDDRAGRAEAIAALRRGSLVALPTDTVYGMAVALDAADG